MHSVSKSAEEILDKAFPVLDKGFVRLVDYLGGDDRIVSAARVSYGKGTKTIREDQGLINYLMRNAHTSPFEQVILTLHCKMPIFVARQWVRHRTARLNEISGRYSVMKPEFYLPELVRVTEQSTQNKQGSGAELDYAQQLGCVTDMMRQVKEVYETYQKELDRGVTRELARIILPLNLYTEWYWQMDLHNLFHFLRLRLDSHAQWEIQQYAKVIAAMAQAVAPMAYNAFENYVLGSVRLDNTQVEAIEGLKSVSDELGPEDDSRAAQAIRHVLEVL